VVTCPGRQGQPKSSRHYYYYKRIRQPSSLKAKQQAVGNELTDFQSSSYLSLKPLMTSFTSDLRDAMTELS